jgi:molecular chaperone GrpE
MAKENKNTAVNEQPESQQAVEPQAATNGTDALQAEITELKQLLDQTKDQLLRKAAEFENYKKRTENEIGERILYATESLLEDLLPVLDDFERSLKVSKSQKDFDVFFNGVQLIYQKLLKVLQQQGVKSYESVGKPFDTAYHDALLQIPKEGVPPHTVIEEVEKGYMLRDKVLRHAKVVVAGEEVKTPPDATDGPISA